MPKPTISALTREDITMRDYELVVLLHPDLEINLDKPLKKVTDIVTSNGGKITKQDVWGKRKLAYPIQKENFAVYVYLEIQLPPEAVAKVEGLYNITDEVIRYLITQPVPIEEEDEEEKEKESSEKPEKKETTKTKSKETVEDKKPKDSKTTKDKEEK